MNKKNNTNTNPQTNKVLKVDDSKDIDLIQANKSAFSDLFSFNSRQRTAAKNPKYAKEEDNPSDEGSDYYGYK